MEDVWEGRGIASIVLGQTEARRDCEGGQIRELQVVADMLMEIDDEWVRR